VEAQTLNSGRGKPSKKVSWDVVEAVQKRAPPKPHFIRGYVRNDLGKARCLESAVVVFFA
jgi:hypothetical protein